MICFIKGFLVHPYTSPPGYWRMNLSTQSMPLLILTPESSEWILNSSVIRALPFLSSTLRRPLPLGDATCPRCRQRRNLRIRYAELFSALRNAKGTANERLFLETVAALRGLNLPTRCKIVLGHESITLGDL